MTSEKLETKSLTILELNYNNYLKANSGKSHVMLTSDDVKQPSGEVKQQ